MNFQYPDKAIFFLLVLLFTSCMALAATTQKETLYLEMRGDAKIRIEPERKPLDVLGGTDWFIGQWPTDTSMPKPKFPRFHVEPVAATDKGLLLAKKFPINSNLDAAEPVLRLSLHHDGNSLPFYSGGKQARIAFRTGNMLRLLDTSEPCPRSLEMIVFSHRLVLMRARLGGTKPLKLGMEIDVNANNAPQIKKNRTLTVHTAQGWQGVRVATSVSPGEALIVAAYDSTTEAELKKELQRGLSETEQFDKLWLKLEKTYDTEPFLSGTETPLQRRLIAVCINRILRNARGSGLIHPPAFLEFYGPEWHTADGVWICFQPACRFTLWMEPSLLSNSLQTLLDQQTADGRIPQAVLADSSFPNSQIPNISSCVRDYYVFTKDREFLAKAYKGFKRWYEWWLAERNPTGDGIFAVGAAKQDLWTSICEYKDNATDPTKPEVFNNTCNPLTRTPEIAGRPERVFLPDIVACQARMAEDLAFMAAELGLDDDARRFSAEYRRVRRWANKTLWDERTQFYYPVIRATGEKVMKRSNVAFWLLWAGIPNEKQKNALVRAMFDPKQFFTTIPLPMIALNDPSFNPRVDHWGDGYVWPIDVFHAFDGLLRYRLWDHAAKLAEQYNHGVFATMENSLQPNEYFHHTGRVAGNPIMGTAGCLPLTFQRYLRDYRAGQAKKHWTHFCPQPMPEN